MFFFVCVFFVCQGKIRSNMALECPAEERQVPFRRGNGRPGHSGLKAAEMPNLVASPFFLHKMGLCERT